MFPAKLAVPFLVIRVYAVVLCVAQSSLVQVFMSGRVRTPDGASAFPEIAVVQ